jgi:hypothetical protein
MAGAPANLCLSASVTSAGVTFTLGPRNEKDTAAGTGGGVFLAWHKMGRAGFKPATK